MGLGLWFGSLLGLCVEAALVLAGDEGLQQAAQQDQEDPHREGDDAGEKETPPFPLLEALFLVVVDAPLLGEEVRLDEARPRLRRFASADPFRRVRF